MKIHLLAFGIAKDILRAKNVSYELKEGNNIATLKSALTSDHPQFRLLSSISFAVNEEYVSDDYILQEGDEVVLIPPVSGG
ncbi:MAG TPA: MoaD/ThiS family protein [Saprospiraceae bacterium]|nr:MoaD/ThiS family protein [Saprospiraceae bacterium]